MSEPHSISLLVVTVNYFSSRLVAQLLSQLSNSELPRSVTMSIVCADNSVSSKECSALRQQCSDYKNANIELSILENIANLGYGPAINNSVKGRTFDYLCCINPDVKLQPNTLRELLHHAMKKPEQGIWGGLTVDEHGVPDYRHAWQEPNLKNTFGWATGLNRVMADDWQDNYKHIPASAEPYPVDNVSGCCFLISADVWETVGGFDSDYFLYSEEIDLCKRARSAGAQPTVVTNALLQHKTHSKDQSKRRISVIYASKLLYARKHSPLTYNLIYRVLVGLGSLIRVGVSSIKLNFIAAKSWGAVFLEATFMTSAHKKAMEQPSRKPPAHRDSNSLK